MGYISLFPCRTVIHLNLSRYSHFHCPRLWRSTSFSSPNHLKFQLDHSTFGRKHRCGYYIDRTRKIKRPRFNHHLQYSGKPDLASWEEIFWDSIPQKVTLQNTSLPLQRLVVPHSLTVLSRWCHLILLNQLFSIFVFCHLTLLSRSATLPQLVILLRKDFVDYFPRLLHLLLFTPLTLTLTTASSLISCR